MLKYIVKRLLGLIPLIVGAMFIAFMVLYLSPGDPATVILRHSEPEVWQEWYELHGFNDPVLIQYVRYMAGVFTGDLGNSFWNNIPVTPEIMLRLPHTLQLSLAALTVALLLALPIGIIAAVKQNTWIDGVSMFIALIGISIPVFWLGLILIFSASRQLGWSPPPRHSWYIQLVLPGITLGTAMLSAMIHSTRFSTLEVMRTDYIKMARAKGLTGGKIIRKHVLRNALPSILEAFKVHLGAFFTGIIIVEFMFAWPGIGRLMIQAVALRDYPMVLGCMFIFILLFAVIKLIADILQLFIDPRVKEQRI